VQGVDADGEGMWITYHPDRAPEVEHRDVLGPFLRPSRIRDLDVADLLARARKRVRFDEEECYILLNSSPDWEVDFYPGGDQKVSYISWQLKTT